MIDLAHLRGRRLVILGLGVSGRAAAAAAAAAGVEVSGWDDGATSRTAAAEAGIPLADPSATGFLPADILLLSPGIPRLWPAPHPVVARALDERVPIRGDMDLLAAACPEARYLGITGTNGKSTTTALIHHVLVAAGVQAQVGGNLGRAALALDPLGAGGWYVLEASSYQLETIETLRWDVAVFLNITPDHLDRYQDLAGYVAAKRRMLAAQTSDGTAVIGIDDDWSRSVHRDTVAAGLQRVVAISSERAVPGGVYVLDGRLIDDLNGDARPVLDLALAPSLPGRHNWQNAAAAYAACRAVGVAPEVIAQALPGFPGLDHRQKLVATIDGVRFVNDSKATNPDAAAKALGSYRRIHWIAGGKPKEGGLFALEPVLGHVARAYLIGVGTDKIARFLEGVVPWTACGDLETATRRAFEAARRDGEGAVVLLSPACASFDQFRSFEHRGAEFRRIVEAIASGDRPGDGNGDGAPERAAEAGAAA